jgi:hypothetical protein
MLADKATAALDACENQIKPKYASSSPA